LAWIGDRVMLGSGEQAFLEKEGGETLGAWWIGKIGVEHGVTEAFSGFEGDELKPQLRMYIPDELAEVPLRDRVRVEVLDVDDKRFGNLLNRLPRFNHPAGLFGDGD